MIKVPEISEAISSCMAADEEEDEAELYEELVQLESDEVYMNGKRE